MSRTPGRVALLTAFTVHNAEEIAFCDGAVLPDPALMARVGLAPGDYRPDRLAIATALLSALVAAATADTAGARSRMSALIGIGTAGALAFNGVGHLARAALTRQYNPGAVTAPLMVGAAVRTIVGLRRQGDISRGDTAGAIAFCTAVSFPAILLSLRAARLVRPRVSEKSRASRKP